MSEGDGKKGHKAVLVLLVALVLYALVPVFGIGRYRNASGQVFFENWYMLGFLVVVVLPDARAHHAAAAEGHVERLNPGPGATGRRHATTRHGSSAHRCGGSAPRRLCRRCAAREARRSPGRRIREAGSGRSPRLRRPGADEESAPPGAGVDEASRGELIRASEPGLGSRNARVRGESRSRGVERGPALGVARDREAELLRGGVRRRGRPPHHEDRRSAPPGRRGDSHSRLGVRRRSGRWGSPGWARSTSSVRSPEGT